MAKINKKLLPIKAHYFLFMAAMGPILPQIAVHGKELGVSAEVMGYITSILPILYVLAKPAVGLLADYFVNFRKLIFVTVILIMTLCYAGFYFIPQPTSHTIPPQSISNFTLNSDFLINQLQNCDSQILTKSSLCTTSHKLKCQAQSSNTLNDNKFTRKEFNIFITLLPQKLPDLFNNFSIDNYNFCIENYNYDNNTGTGLLSCELNMNELPDCLYGTLTFWLYVILLCIGTIGYNITNCISDAICFDVLGDNQQNQYGRQRVWGTIGFGLTALLSGIAVNLSTNDLQKSLTPAILIMLFFSFIDIFMIKYLQLPKSNNETALFHEIGILLKKPSILKFLCFATLAGIMDSFIIYFLFWHLEQIAEQSGYINDIKLIEGLVVAAECLCGEIPMFLYSGKIIQKLGYVNCLSLCFLTYSIRLSLISIIVNPWYLILIEMFMQGCTYALCYTCIVAYASAIAPPGTSATIQGLVAGMDDGLGFAIGSLIGGQLYQNWGGRKSFQFFALMSLITCFLHMIFRRNKHNDQDQNILNALPSEQTKLNVKPIIEITSKT